MASAALSLINPNADVARRGLALQLNVNAALGLQSLLKTNLGPKGTLKMLVSGSGDLKLTKDGKVLLSEMQFQNATAAMIARAASAQDEICGDGTTSNVLLIGELLKVSERYISEGTHPRLIADGFEIARKEALKLLDEIKQSQKNLNASGDMDRESLIAVARTSLRTKLPKDLADSLTCAVVDAVLSVQSTSKDGSIDLHMVEIMKMHHHTNLDSTLVRGLVLDHGARHPDMPRKLGRTFVLILNVSLEYEKTEVNSGFYYSSAETRSKLAESERAFIDDRVRKIVEFKKSIVSGSESNTGFMIINQKGIDPLSLDMLAHAGILALRRAKRRNMERLQKIVGGTALNSLEGDSLCKDALGIASNVHEEVYGEEKYTFVEVGQPQQGSSPVSSVTILLKGNSNTDLATSSDAVRDGLRAVKNAIEDGSCIPGAGFFFLKAHHHLISNANNLIEGKAKLGLIAFAEALLVIPKTLAGNAGFDVQEALLNLQTEISKGRRVGLDLSSFSSDFTLDPVSEGIWDNYRVLRHLLHSCTVIASNLLLVDEMMKAGRANLKGGAANE